jgi:aryl-alcohol dehydrogenase-like predicted oxidoreductase
VPPEYEEPHAVIEIYSTWSAFAALKADGSIKVWGESSNNQA